MSFFSTHPRFALQPKKHSDDDTHVETEYNVIAFQSSRLRWDSFSRNWMKNKDLHLRLRTLLMEKSRKTHTQAAANKILFTYSVQLKVIFRWFVLCLFSFLFHLFFMRALAQRVIYSQKMSYRLIAVASPNTKAPARHETVKWNIEHEKWRKQVKSVSAITSRRKR